MQITVTPEQFEKIKQALGLKGLVITGTNGDAARDGVHIHYNYAAPTLNIEVVSKPWFIKEATIDKEIEEWINNVVVVKEEKQEPTLTPAPSTSTDTKNTIAQAVASINQQPSDTKPVVSTDTVTPESAKEEQK